jgi:hypothetical protein
MGGIARQIDFVDPLPDADPLLGGLEAGGLLGDIVPAALRGLGLLMN